MHFSVIWYACFATRPPVLLVYSLVPVYLLPCVPSCFSILLVYVCYSFLAFSAVILARFHFSVSYSASVKGTVANSMLFAPIPCNASINKSSASHFCQVRVRILWLLAAVNCLSLPFTYRTLCGRASLFPPSLPFLSFPLPIHSSAVPFLRLLFSERERDCRE